MEICKDLRLLAQEFKKNNYDLFVTGGFVRDSLINLSSKDIDISSNAPYEKVSLMCKKLKFKCIPVNKKLGTLKIITSTQEYEYTRFRSESYSQGNHSPDSVVFVDDISEDAKRRDLTINALYYNILEDRIIDLVHGQKDLENQIIRTANHPSITLQDDGLRILRVIRFASLLNFKIDKLTYKYLKEYKYKLKDISKERILKELSTIATSDLTHELSNQISLSTFNKLDLYPYIFNSSFSKIKLSKQDIKRFYSLSSLARLMGLYMLVLRAYHKSYMPSSQVKFSCNLLLGQEGIKESSNNIATLEKVYFIYQNLEFNIDTINASINYLTLSNTEREIIDALLSKQSKTRLSGNISFIKSKKLPLGIHDLNICAQDLLDNNIEGMYIGKILSTLFNQVIEMKVLNQKEDLLELAKNIHETFTTITKQLEGEKNENNILPSRTKSSRQQKTKKSRWRLNR